MVRSAQGGRTLTVMPADNVSIIVELIKPITMEEGLCFAIREGAWRHGRRQSSRRMSNEPGIAWLLVIVGWFYKE
jgi:hypothetical protein